MEVLAEEARIKALKTTKKRKGRQGNQRARNWRPPYLKALAITGMYAKAAAAAAVDFSTVWRERKSNAEFAAQEKEAQDIATAQLEDEAVRRARDGCVRYKFHPKTGEVYEELEYSDTLLLKLLSAKKPELYKDKVEHSGRVHLTLDELELEQRRKDADA